MYYQDQMHAGSSCVRLWNVPLNRPVTSQLSGWMEWIMHRWSAPQQSTSERVTWSSVALESAVVINKGFTKGGKLSGGPGQPGYSEPLSQYFKYFMLRIMSSCSEPRYHQTDGLTDWRTDRAREDKRGEEEDDSPPPNSPERRRTRRADRETVVCCRAIGADSNPLVSSQPIERTKRSLSLTCNRGASQSQSNRGTDGQL